MTNLPADPVSAACVADLADVGLFVVQDEHIVYANRKIADMLGWTVETLCGQPHELVVAPADRPAASVIIARRLTGKIGRPGLISCQRRDHSEFAARSSSRRIEYLGRPAVLVTLHETTELDEATQRARWNADMLARTESLCRTGSFEIFLPEGRINLSDGMRSMVAAESAEATIDHLPWVSPEEQSFVAGFWRSAEPGEPFEFEHRILRADGRRMLVLHRGIVANPPTNGLPQRGVALLQDITAQREAETRARVVETHDEVTGLPNRKAFLEQLDSAVHSARWACAIVQVLAVDIAQIGEAKAMMGFGAGDTLAMALAARLQECARPGEVVARLSDTEFALMHVVSSDDAAQIRDPSRQPRARQIIELLEQPVRLGATDIYPRCLVGIASFPGDSEQHDALLECAQKAILNANERSRIAVFEPNSNAHVLRRIQIESGLRRALELGELSLHYQAQADLSAGAIVGAEALLRWRSAELGDVSPSEFIPEAERCGMIGALGDWVLRRACEQAVAWRRQGLRPVRIGINLSPSQLANPGFARELQAALIETGADPAQIGVEITESCAMADAARAQTVLREIKALGVEISLDDFGTGFSSLSHLRSLPIDVVKVDRSFVHDITASPADVSVTRAIIKMAHGLQMQVVAEGVETEGQLSLLASQNCDRIQGFWFSRPVPSEDFAALLREDRKIPARFLTRVRSSRTLLLVDDEPNILASLKRLLRPDGYQILIAGSGAEALQCMTSSEVDVIVSDQRMPGMTGVELLRRAKELYPDSVRMVLSGYTELQSILDAVNEGAIYKFLTKPWDDQQLRNHVSEAFRQKEMSDENRRLNLQIENANANYMNVNARLEKLLSEQRQESDLAWSPEAMRKVFDSLPSS